MTKLERTWQTIERIKRERDTACMILERLAEKLGNEDIFDDDWYRYENLIMEDLREFGIEARKHNDYKIKRKAGE